MKLPRITIRRLLAAASLAVVAAMFVPTVHRAVSIWAYGTIGRGEIARQNAFASSGKKILVDLRGEKFLIPAGYFMEPYRPGHGDILLWFLWPNIEPYSPGRHFEFWKAAGDANRRVMVWLSPHGENPSTVLYERIKPSLSNDIPQRNYDFGLKQMSVRPKYHKDIFLVGSAPHLDGVIQCSMSGDVPYPQCDLEKIINKTIIVNITFQRNFLPYWAKIAASVEKIITKFADEAYK